MATAEEKQAKQDALDAQKQAVVAGQQRLQTEVGKAAGAFPVRRLRSAGDLSRYAVGGFLSDPTVGGTGTVKPRVVPTGSGTGGGTGSGSGTTPPPKPVSGVPSGTLPPIGTRTGGGAAGNDLRHGGGTPGPYRPPVNNPALNVGANASQIPGAGRLVPPGIRGGTGTGTTKANQTLTGGAARDYSKAEIGVINRGKGVKPTAGKSQAVTGKRAGGGATAKAKANAAAKAKGKATGTGKANKTLKGGAARDYGKKELGAINRAKGAVQKPKAKAKSSGTGSAAKRRAM